MFETTLQFRKVNTLNDIFDLRNQYLDQLEEAQEMYLELMVRQSIIYIIEKKEQSIGYFLLGDESTLLEYFIVPEEIDKIDAIFQIVVHEFKIKSALCKSFDQILLSCCMDIQINVEVLGYNFRDLRDIKIDTSQHGLIVRPAVKKDEPAIAELNEDIFENADELQEYIEKKQVLIFGKEGQIAGIGIFGQNNS